MGALDIHGLVKPLLRGRLHLGAFVVAIPAAVLLVGASRSPRATAAATVYGITLVALFGVSACYHRLGRTVRAQLFWRRADHATIYGLIAGTYTPVALVAVGGRAGWVVVAVAWGLAAIGMLLKLVWFEHTRTLGWVLYLGMGWLVVLAAPVLVSHVSGPELALLVAGGLLYTVGAIVLGRRWPNPYPLVFGYHEVWHTLVIVAAACHYTAILLIVQAG